MENIPDIEERIENEETLGAAKTRGLRLERPDGHCIPAPNAGAARTPVPPG